MWFKNVLIIIWVLAIVKDLIRVGIEATKDQGSDEAAAGVIANLLTALFKALLIWGITIYWV